jgi:hypothetical protein
MLGFSSVRKIRPAQTRISMERVFHARAVIFVVAAWWAAVITQKTPFQRITCTSLKSLVFTSSQKSRSGIFVL